MSICDLIQHGSLMPIEERCYKAGFGAGGGFGDGFSAGNHGLTPDQNMMQQPQLQRPQPYGMDQQTTLPDYGIPPIELQPPTPEFPLAGSSGNLITGRYDGMQERVDMSGHNGSQPHINYDLMGASGAYSANALGDAHARQLWNDAIKQSEQYVGQTFLQDFMGGMK